MQRYSVTHSRKNPPQYLGGVREYDVFYWTAAHDGRERLIVKWEDRGDTFLWWDFGGEVWRDSVFRPKIMPPDDHETIMAMYECFAVKPNNQNNGELK